MTAPPPRRPLWKRKGTWAALALWLVVAYPLSSGPVHWLYGRKFVPPSGHRVLWRFYAPARFVFLDDRFEPRPGCGWFVRYSDACYEVGRWQRLGPD